VCAIGALDPPSRARSRAPVRAVAGATAAAFRARYPNIPETLSTVVYIDGDRAHLRSKAFLHLAKHLRGPWRWIHAFRWFPAILLDLLYRLVAATRYKIFARPDSCELPSPENRARFLRIIPSPRPRPCPI